MRREKLYATNLCFGGTCTLKRISNFLREIISNSDIHLTRTNLILRSVNLLHKNVIAISQEHRISHENIFFNLFVQHGNKDKV